MDYRDREAIEGLFIRLKEVEGRIPRDREAEALIREKIAEHPASTYYMAQTIIVQQQALEEAERRIAALEAGRPSGGARRQRGYDPGPQPWGAPAYGGGGFLAGAAQTALGVAGGVLLGSMIAGAFAGDAEAAEADQDGAGDDADSGDAGGGGGDAGGDFGGDGGGDFGGGDF